MREIRNSMAESLKASGFDKISDDPTEPALSEEEHLEELCLVANYLAKTLAHYVAKNGLIHDAEDVETSSVPDVS